MSADPRIPQPRGKRVTESGATGLPVRYDPLFIEEAVFLALQGHPDAEHYHNQRSGLYEINDSEERERSFQDLHCVWFIRLGLADQIEKAIHEQPPLTSTVKCCIVAPALRKREEGAELFVIPEEGLSEKERRTVRILLRPESLLDPQLLTFLRHELLHITDMLDPRFSYEPVLPAAEGGPTHDRLLQDRYRILWDATIDGRMVRRGWVSESIRTEHLCNFTRAFPMFGVETDQVFNRFFGQESHTHGELVAFACNPRAAVEGSEAMPYPGSRCPLCGFPTHAFEPEPEQLAEEVTARIAQDFSQWHPSQGLCTQCADLYRARQLSSCAGMHLPGSISHRPTS